MHKQIEQHYVENFDKFVKIYTNRAGSVWNAEDIVQDAFDLAMRYQSSFDPSRQSLGGWFNGILNNSLRLFKKKERLLGMSVEYSEDIEDSLDDNLADCELEDNLLKAILLDIEKKPEVLRQALYLYMFKQYKPREIAQIVDMSNTYIRTTVKEFKQEMRKKYGDVI